MAGMILPGGAPRRVLTAYEQVYEQLRKLIVSGSVTTGERLPNEVALAHHYGVSRGTVREALKLLVNEGLVKTAKGATGGSYVTLPTLDYVSELLERNVELLTVTDTVTLPEFLDARELLEVHAVRQVAARHTPDDIDRLRRTLAGEHAGLTPYELYLRNREFHAVLVDACGNALLTLAAQPIFFVLHTRLVRSPVDAEFPRHVCTEHAAILELIERRDVDGAEAAMRAHLAYLSGVYERLWRGAAAAAAL